MEKYQPKYQKNPKKRVLSVFSTCMLAVLVLAVGLTAFVWAKYTSQQEKDTVVAAKAFYFESDLLSETNPTYTLTPGTKTISFRLKNHADDLRYSDVNISYEVTATARTTKTGSLTGGNKSSTEVKLENLTAGTYTVTARAVSPYTKTLKATFVIPAADNDISYSVSDAAGSPVLRLTVRSGDYSGKVNITWPAGISPDNTDPLLKSAVNVSSVSIDFTNDSEYTFVFFKNTPSKVYSENDIKAQKG